MIKLQREDPLVLDLLTGVLHGIENNNTESDVMMEDSVAEVSEEIPVKESEETPIEEPIVVEEEITPTVENQDIKEEPVMNQDIADEMLQLKEEGKSLKEIMEAFEFGTKGTYNKK